MLIVKMEDEFFGEAVSSATVARIQADLDLSWDFDRCVRVMREVSSCLLGAVWCEGREVRGRLNAGKWWWQRWSGPAFYRMMTQLEAARLVERALKMTPVEGMPGVNLYLTMFRVAQPQTLIPPQGGSGTTPPQSVQKAFDEALMDEIRRMS